MQVQRSCPMMQIDYTHLAALLAVERAGSFEGAGRLLHISPIGVSRRIAKFEKRLGIRLLTRKPTRPTEAGQALCRYAETIEQLENTLMAEAIETGLQDGTSGGVLKIAMDEHSLSGWFRAVLARDNTKRACGPSVLEDKFDIAIIDPNHTVDAMRSGRVVAALSSVEQPIHGFKTYNLVAMHYHAVASPDFIARHFADGLNEQALSAAPALRRCRHDTVLLDWIEEVTGTGPAHCVQSLPCPSAIVDRCLAGAAWAVLPECLVRPHLDTGRLFEIVPDTPLRKELYWHVASALVERMSGLTASIRNAAHTR